MRLPVERARHLLRIRGRGWWTLWTWWAWLTLVHWVQSVHCVHFSLLQILYPTPRRLDHLILCAAEAVDVFICKTNRDVVTKLRHFEAFQFSVTAVLWD